MKGRNLDNTWTWWGGNSQTWAVSAQSALARKADHTSQVQTSEYWLLQTLYFLPRYQVLCWLTVSGKVK